MIPDYIDHKIVKCISEGAFKNSLYSDIHITDNILVIGKSSFNGCKNLQKINLPDKIKQINECTFCNCINLEKIEFPDNVVEISTKAFAGCRKLKTVILPESIRFIGKSAFAGCYNLKEIYIPENCKRIAKSAFNLFNVKGNSIIRNSIIKIICKRNSYAQKYAIENSIAYELIA